MKLSAVVYAVLIFAILIFTQVTFYGNMIDSYSSVNATGFNANPKINSTWGTEKYSNMTTNIKTMYAKTGGGANETTNQTQGVSQYLQMIPGYNTASQIFNGLQVAKSFLIAIADSFNIGMELISRSVELIGFPIPGEVISLISLGLLLAVLFSLVSVILQWKAG